MTPNFCQLVEAAPNDPTVMVNPNLVRAFRSHGDSTEIIFSADHSIIVGEAVHIVAKKLNPSQSPIRTATP